MSNSIRLASVLVALSLSSVIAGCAVETEPVASEGQALTSIYDGVTVVGERDGEGNVRAEPKNDRGESLLVLRVEGDRLTIEPRADQTVAPWSGTVPADVVTTNGLGDWSYLAYAYAQRVSPLEANGSGEIRPQMMSAGTDGQMCIAAGGTTMQCTYWLYCRKNWCPFW
jgi:hypothetical protein